MRRGMGIGPYATVGLDMVLSIVVGLYGGRWLDRRFGTRFWAVVGFLLGVAAAFNVLWKAARRLREETEREDREASKDASHKESKKGQAEQTDDAGGGRNVDE